MNSVKVTTESGYSWETSINGTFATVAQYFLGQRFNVGTVTEEKMEKAVSVEMSDEDGKPIGSLAMMERDNIRKKHIMQLLGISSEEAMEMANYCDEIGLSATCFECPNQVPCRTVDQKLMIHPKLNGKKIGCYFMSDMKHQAENAKK